MAKNTGEIGYTGLLEYNGQIKDDFLREFHGKEAYKRFNEMRLNNAVIGSGLLAIEQLLRAMSWEFVSDDENDPWLDMLNEARAGMSNSWNDFISEVASFVWAGFSLFEIVYRKDERNRMMWRKFASRGQDTIYKWLFDEKGGLAGFTQLSAPTYQAVDIPIDKVILFRTRVEKNNPEGRSLLRIAWVSYYYLKNLQQIEAIGFERDVNGLPVIKLPDGANTNEDDDNSDASKAAKIVRNMRIDEQAGLVLPFGWDAMLLSGSGKSFEALSNAIERYEKRIATAFFSQFLLLGQDGVGSLALSKNTVEFFLSSVNSIADIIAETFTKYAVQRLLKLNGATDEEAQGIRLEHTPANTVDLTSISAFIGAVKDLLTWDEGDELWLRQLAGAPERDPEQLKGEREAVKAERKEAARALMDRTRDNNRVTIYAADAPDEDKRVEMEEKYAADVGAFLEKQRKRILKAAKELRDGKPA